MDDEEEIPSLPLSAFVAPSTKEREEERRGKGGNIIETEDFTLRVRASRCARETRGSSIYLSFTVFSSSSRCSSTVPLHTLNKEEEG